MTNISDEQISKVYSQLYKGSFMWTTTQEKFRHPDMPKGDYYQWSNTGFLLNNYENNAPINKEMLDRTDWEIFEENKFGNFYVKEGDIYVNFGDEGVYIKNKHLEDLEKAIKQARKSQ